MTDVATYILAGAAALQALTLIASAIFAGIQLRVNAKPRYFEGLYRVYEEFDTDHARRQRHAVYALPDQVPADAVLSDNVVELLKDVTNRYDFIGHLVLTGILPDKYVIPVYYLQVVRIWTKVQPYIAYIRRTRGLGATYHRRFEQLYKKCERYRRRHNPQAAVRVTEGGTPLAIAAGSTQQTNSK